MHRCVVKSSSPGSSLQPADHPSREETVNAHETARYNIYRLHRRRLYQLHRLRLYLVLEHHSATRIEKQLKKEHNTTLNNNNSAP